MNRLFKKTLSLMLVIVMTVSLGVSAAAADQTGAAQAERGTERTGGGDQDLQDGRDRRQHLL